MQAAICGPSCGLYAATEVQRTDGPHTAIAGVPTTGLRFFTVYGPWGRPDMALFLFTKAILTNQPIDVFNNGDMLRDFTYIDDIVESIFRLLIKVTVKEDTFVRNIPNPS